MNIFYFSIKNIRFRALSSLLTLLLLTLGSTIIFMVLSLGEQVERAFSQNLRDTDMVVGAKGSPLQLILSSIYHMDAPTGNISLEEAKTLKKNPMVKSWIPLSYGDNYEGYRILGTDTAFDRMYSLVLSEGRQRENPLEVNLGYDAAQALMLKTGDQFYSAHGLDKESDHIHENAPFTVVGIFSPSNTIADRLVITPLESIWEIHSTHSHEEEDHHHDADHEEAHEHGPECDHDHHETDDHQHNEDIHDHKEAKEITAVLISFKSPVGNLTIPRQVNENTSMQAALPAIEINRLFSLLGLGERLIRALAILLIAVAAGSLFISLLNTIKERQYELAMMRSLGAGPLKVVSLLLSEAFMLVTMALALGYALSRLGLILLDSYTPPGSIFHFRPTLPGMQEWLIVGLIYLVSFLAVALPSIRVYRLDVSKTLSTLGQ